MKRREELRIAHQYRFGEDGVEPPDEPTETTFTDWGVEIDSDQSEPRIDRPAASEFGVDDRVEVRTSPADKGEQQTLALDPEQQTLDDSVPTDPDPDADSDADADAGADTEVDI